MGNKRKMMGGAIGRGLQLSAHHCLLSCLLAKAWGTSGGVAGLHRSDTLETTPRCHMSLMNRLSLGSPGMPIPNKTSSLPLHPPDCTASQELERASVCMTRGAPAGNRSCALPSPWGSGGFSSFPSSQYDPGPVSLPFIVS